MKSVFDTHPPLICVIISYVKEIMFWNRYPPTFWSNVTKYAVFFLKASLSYFTRPAWFLVWNVEWCSCDNLCINSLSLCNFSNPKTKSLNSHCFWQKRTISWCWKTYWPYFSTMKQIKHVKRQQYKLRMMKTWTRGVLWVPTRQYHDRQWCCWVESFYPILDALWYETPRVGLTHY